MSAKKLNLITPDKTSIVGVKVADGGVSDFTFFYDDQTKLHQWIIPPNIVEKDDSYLFVDNFGKEYWLNKSDVVFGTLTNYLI